ncbi:hypothetical protein BpHYR1_009229 [Brachionus plicatilis]|uniref:Uncharacterized protein n=1 Tax=Brachionus plicatilis TaxID=10195 RepID=A0A3M7Q251_BRAPC|nr:hypothetical protein BpHYR1_009229 [Brachionus plicatilis]
MELFHRNHYNLKLTCTFLFLDSSFHLLFLFPLFLSSTLRKGKEESRKIRGRVEEKKCTTCIQLIVLNFIRHCEISYKTSNTIIKNCLSHLFHLLRQSAKYLKILQNCTLFKTQLTETDVADYFSRKKLFYLDFSNFRIFKT